MLQLQFQRYKRIITYFHAVLYLSYSSSLTEFLFLRDSRTNAIAVYFMVSLNVSLSKAGVLVCLWELELIYVVLGIGDYGLCEHSLFFFALLSQHHSINIFNCVPVLCRSLCLPCDFYNWTNIARKIQLGCVLLS